MVTGTRTQGYTLFEMTAVICIVMVVAMTCLHNFSSYIKQERGRLAINRLATAVMEARHQALSHRAVVTLCPVNGTSRCQGDWEGKLVLFAGRSDDSSAEIISTYEATDGGRVEWRSFRQDDFLEMQGNGLTLAQNGSFVYCPYDNDEHYAHALILNKSGRARVAIDSNNDGIRELRPGVPISC